MRREIQHRLIACDVIVHQLLRVLLRCQVLRQHSNNISSNNNIAPAETPASNNNNSQNKNLYNQEKDWELAGATLPHRRR